jgi:hypothetical protein
MTRTGRWLGCLALALVITGVAGAPPAEAKRTYVYLHDRQMNGGIYGWQMDKKGRLTELPGSPWALVDDGGGCGGACQTMAYSSKRKMLVTGSPNGVTSWVVAKDGTLSVPPGSPAVVNGADFLGTGVVQIKKRVFVYAASFPNDEIHIFELEEGGLLTALGTASLPPGSRPDGLETRKKVVFAANEGDTDLAVPSSVATFVAQNDGSLVAAPGSPYAIPDVDFVFNVWPDPKGKRVYVYDDGIETAGSVIHGWNVNKKTGALTPIDGSPFDAFPDGPKAGLAVSKKLIFAIDYDDGTNDVQPFRTRKKGRLESTGIIFDSNLFILAFAIDKKGKKFLVATSTALVSNRVTNKKGDIETVDAVSLLDLNPNAVVIVKR